MEAKIVKYSNHEGDVYGFGWEMWLNGRCRYFAYDDFETYASALKDLQDAVSEQSRLGVQMPPDEMETRKVPYAV